MSERKRRLLLRVEEESDKEMSLEWEKEVTNITQRCTNKIIQLRPA